LLRLSKQYGHLEGIQKAVNWLVKEQKPNGAWSNGSEEECNNDALFITMLTAEVIRVSNMKGYEHTLLQAEKWIMDQQSSDGSWKSWFPLIDIMIIEYFEKTKTNSSYKKSREFEYDIALSFASEQRDYAEKVAQILKNEGIKVFYDKFEESQLWGKDLYEYLDEIYSKKSKYCVIFISADYASKLWTTHERKSAQTRAFEEKSEYILPVRFDDTEIPGIRKTVGYIDALKTSEELLAIQIRNKLSS
jgi:hypothetical protein